MKWDDTLFRGQRDDWHWVVSRRMVLRLPELVGNYFPNCVLCITAFDSGHIQPSAEERALGWSTLGDVMISPPLRTGLDIPCDQYDEWFIVAERPTAFPEFDAFVNYGDFNLADPHALAATFDPTWEHFGLDWLYPLQQQFWQIINEIQPAAYIASGDNDIVVSRSVPFVEAFIDSTVNLN
jgi:hypothetical protein